MIYISVNYLVNIRSIYERHFLLPSYPTGNCRKSKGLTRKHKNETFA